MLLYRRYIKQLVSLLNVNLLVVQDIFLTETAEYADVVLPDKSWGKVEGTYTNTDRRIQRVRKAVEAAPDVKEDWGILGELSTRLGYKMNYKNSEQIWNDVRELVWEMYGGISYERLEKEYSIHYPCPHEQHPGTKILHHNPVVKVNGYCSSGSSSGSV
ncbi:molybdopterin-dependent oxidoreductase [Mesobacillus maritimus]|nr:molybdopterin-dependent oxidoreductase [Mesobacillus maritimus]MCM3588106.1 molybdopterin-dependent oxidoreductase [Mesobacillus maritimus]